MRQNRRNSGIVTPDSGDPDDCAAPPLFGSQPVGYSAYCNDDRQKEVFPVPATETSKQQSAKDFAIAAAKLAANTRCTNVVLLDVSAVSPITDFLVIATGTSARQMRSVCDDVEELGEPMGYKALARAGYDGETWILADFVHVVVHVFSAEARGYYDLDNLWGDGEKINWQS